MILIAILKLKWLLLPVRYRAVLFSALIISAVATFFLLVGMPFDTSTVVILAMGWLVIYVAAYEEYSRQYWALRMGKRK